VAIEAVEGYGPTTARAVCQCAVKLE